MEKCRICLVNCTMALSIYERVQNVSYADIITSVANVKILGDDGLTHKICKSCCKRLIEVNEFKLLIERSDAILNQISNSKLKRISFNNLTEIDFTQIKEENDLKENIQDIVINFENGENVCTYKNISIKKCESLCNKDFIMPMSAVDFLSNFSVDGKNKGDNNYFYEIYDDDAQYDSDETFLDDNFNIQEHLDNTDISASLRMRSGNTYARKVKEKKIKNVKRNKEDDENDEEYFPGKPKIHKKQNSATERKSNNLAFDKGITPKCRIRPVIRNDLRVISTKPALPFNKRKPRKKKEKSKICPHCGKCSKNMNSHLLSHSERKYICDMCNKGYFSINILKSHIKHIHTNNNKTYKCDECVAAFSSVNVLNKHKLSHKDKCQRPLFTCELCTKKFTNKSSLRLHIIRHNSANKTVMCELCNMSFFEKCRLKQHMRVHTGERPFKCELCSQPYSYKHDFNRHCFKKHGIFLKRRQVHVMNEEVLARERKNMRELVLRANGIRTEGAPLNLFENEGNHAWLAIDQAMKDLKKKKIDFSDLI